MLEKNQRYAATIEGYTEEGLGVTHVNGIAVFVHNALQGETCEIQIVKSLAKYAYAKVIQIKEQSPNRVEPKCPAFRQCGGCCFWHMTYEEELRAKKQRVQDCLQRIGKSDVQVEEILGADTFCNYRNKAQYPISSAGEVGFYKARTHEVVSIQDCRIEKSESNKIANAVALWIKENHICCYNEKTKVGYLRHLFVRTNHLGESLVCIVTANAKVPAKDSLVSNILKVSPKVAGILLNINNKDTNVVLGDQYEKIWGKTCLEETLCDMNFSLSVPSFFQVNREQAEKLYNKAVKLADIKENEIVLDLYCGTGTITCLMAKFAKKVIGVEIVPEAIEDAKLNAVRNGLSKKVEFICTDADKAANEIRENKTKLDVICVDPPRKGLTEVVISNIVQMEPERIVYISCNPSTLARDIAIFEQKGFTTKKALAVDMFPRTAHVEAVVLMSRK